MKNILSFTAVVFSFLHCLNSFSQPFNYPKSDTLPGTDRNGPGIVLSLGAGTSVYETSFILSPDITWDLNDFASVSTGTDIFFARKNSETRVSINLISYYKIRPSARSIIQVGFGGAYFNKSILPLFSARYDHKIFGNNYIGVGLKSMISFGGDKFPFPIMQVNYSIRF